MPHPVERMKRTPVVEWNAGHDRPGEDAVTIEEPIEIRVGGAPVSVTMRTPGDDFQLSAGFLFTDRIIARRDDIAGLDDGQGADRQSSPERGRRDPANP